MNDTRIRCDQCGIHYPCADNSDIGEICTSCHKGKLMRPTPYPDRDCPACERGEETVTPPHSSIVGSMPVHRPSGNVCQKYISPGMLDTLKRAQMLREQPLPNPSHSIDCSDPHCLGCSDRPPDDNQHGSAVLFVAAGWSYSHAIAGAEICTDRSCFRCRLAALLSETEEREGITGPTLETAGDLTPDVKRRPLPPADTELTLFALDSPARPGNEPQPGDQDWTMKIPLHNGVRLNLHIGRASHANFTAILAAEATDDAEDALKEAPRYEPEIERDELPLMSADGSLLMASGTIERDPTDPGYTVPLPRSDAAKQNYEWRDGGSHDGEEHF